MKNGLRKEKVGRRSKCQCAYKGKRDQNVSDIIWHGGTDE